MNYSLAVGLRKHSIETPDAIAVATETEQLSYRTVAKLASRIADVLVQSPAFQHQSDRRPRVAILASRSTTACIGMMGACWAGATYVPIGLKLPETRILSILSQCAPCALVIDDEGEKLLGDNVVAACPPLIIGSGAPAPRLPPRDRVNYINIESLYVRKGREIAQTNADDTAYIIFTSGTSGVPKGVMVSAGSARHYITAITQQLGLGPHDRVLETCDLAFDFSVHNRFSTWEAGGSLHILPSTHMMNAVKFAQERRLTVWNSVPSLAAMLSQIKALKANSLPDLRLAVFGGEPLTKRIVDAWQEAAPNGATVNLYGPTEVTVFCLGQSVTSQTPTATGRDFVAIGKELPGNKAAILDDDNEEVADGIAGQLAIAGPQLAQGYLNAPEVTAGRFLSLRGNRWYLTGDQAVRDKDGSFHCLGRVDNQVKISGYRVELEEVDAHLRTVSGAELVGTVAWPIDNGMARGLVGFVGAASVDLEGMVSELKCRLPSYMVPHRVIAIERMPVNQSGKVDRHALRALLDE